MTTTKKIIAAGAIAGALLTAGTMNGNLTGKFGTRVNHHRREVAARRAQENAS